MSNTFGTESDYGVPGTASSARQKGVKGGVVAGVGLLAAVASSLICFFIANNIVKQLGWQLHPEISGSTMYYLGVFFFSLFFIPALFLLLFVIALPIVYVFCRNRDKPVPIIATSLWFMACEAAYTALVLANMESYGTLVLLFLALIMPCTVLSLLLIVPWLNARLVLKK